jgi:hypothetical protein
MNNGKIRARRSTAKDADFVGAEEKRRKRRNVDAVPAAPHPAGVSPPVALSAPSQPQPQAAELPRLTLAEVKADYKQTPYSDKFVRVVFTPPTSPLPTVKLCKCCKTERPGKCGQHHHCSGKCYRDQSRASAAPVRYRHPDQASHDAILVNTDRHTGIHIHAHTHTRTHTHTRHATPHAAPRASHRTHTSRAPPRLPFARSLSTCTRPCCNSASLAAGRSLSATP